LTPAKFVYVSQSAFFVRHANAQTAIVRVANAWRLVRSILTSIVDAQHKNYNLADFLLPLNSYTDKGLCMALNDDADDDDDDDDDEIR
jgi:hypothetical protein